ncbi:putative DEAD-box ATP-dependent RNA helicase 42 [Paratrimastix pyriformis]|uniref:RNA helicase n=1 Tax=Paratrimastix pyriformis TaxID=342808 RepID=A0ABQ8UYT1_9EUKA|nr:putative DEAD-box ATP-dependent RNA helicase 42 [Paratrimastix pyriformis]
MSCVVGRTRTLRINFTLCPFEKTTRTSNSRLSFFASDAHTSSPPIFLWFHSLLSGSATPPPGPDASPAVDEGELLAKKAKEQRKAEIKEKESEDKWLEEVEPEEGGAAVLPTPSPAPGSKGLLPPLPLSDSLSAAPSVKKSDDDETPLPFSRKGAMRPPQAPRTPAGGATKVTYMTGDREGGRATLSEKQGETPMTSGQAPAPEVPPDIDPLDMYMMGHDDDDDDPQAFDPESGWLANLQKKKEKRKEMPVIDHSAMDYLPFRKNFLIEPPEVRAMTDAQVAVLRQELEGIRIKGKDCPRPLKNWEMMGLNDRILYVLKEKLGFKQPTPIQAQAIPAIMAGRDVIASAKTGSGKTLAYVLPMLRHVLDQPRVELGEGPIALIIAPTRELAVQIYHDARKLAIACGLRVLCAYGGSGISEQIAELKRGAEVVVCTPGRMIDLLCANSGRVTNLKRASYVVLDEADRMFDMGFIPQVTRIMENVQPDRQTVLSATPRQLEALARQILKRPLEIIVGGKSVVCSDVTQQVLMVDEQNKFVRLLEILKEHHNRGQVIVFVAQQEKADGLFKQLVQAGYSCMPLHGGRDQADRDSTITDFKNGEINILVATSVAARGLDVKSLVLVVNYECPNHLEDYVHRVGRTGRAGNKGTAITFVTPEEEKYAPDLVRALQESKAAIPEDLKKMAEDFQAKLSQNLAHAHSSGFGGKGFKFDETEAAQKDAELTAQKIWRADAPLSVSAPGQEYGAIDPEELHPNTEELLLEAEMAADEAANPLGPAMPPSALEPAAALSGLLPGGAPAAPMPATAAAAAGVLPTPGGTPGLLPQAGAPGQPANPALQAAIAAAMKIQASRGGGAVVPPPPAGSPQVPPASYTSTIVAGQRLVKTSDGLEFNAPLNATPEQARTALRPDPACAPFPLILLHPPCYSPHCVIIIVASSPHGVSVFSSGVQIESLRRAALVARSLRIMGAAGAAGAVPKVVIGTTHHVEEVEINDYPQPARYRITHKARPSRWVHTRMCTVVAWGGRVRPEGERKASHCPHPAARQETLADIVELTGVAITTRGFFFAPGKHVPAGQRKLYLCIEGAEESAVKRAKFEVLRIITEASAGAPMATSTRYTV